MLEMRKEYTYRQICEILGWKVQTGKAKQAQIKEIEACFEFYHPMNKKTHKPKKSYIFTKQLREPVDPSENHGGARNTKNITPMIQYMKAIIEAENLGEYHSFSDWYSYNLNLMDNFTGSMIYKYSEEIESFCAENGIKNMNLFKDYVSCARSILKRIFLKALERMSKDGECTFYAGYKFIYQLGKRTTGNISSDSINEQILANETMICDSMNEKHKLSKKMKGRQLLMKIYSSESLQEEFDELKIVELMGNGKVIDQLNNEIEDIYGYAYTGISDKNPLINYFPAVNIVDMDFNYDCSQVEFESLALEVTNIIRAKAKKEILNKHIKLKDANGNVYDRIYKYTDLSDRDDIKVIENLLYVHRGEDEDGEELNIDDGISEIDDIIPDSYDVWGEVKELEDKFDIDDDSNYMYWDDDYYNAIDAFYDSFDGLI